MSITPGHLVLNTLQDLSRAVSRAGARDPSKDFTRIIPNPSKAYALGGLGVAVAGKDAPAPVRFGAITINPRPVGPMIGMSTGVHQAVGRAYDHPGVRFGDRSRGSARPLSADGAQTFHFSHSYHSKTSPILDMIKAARGGRRYLDSTATAHLLYIERDGAAEKVAREKEYPGYDPDVAEDRFAMLEREAEGRSAEAQQDYLERPGAVERTPIKNLSDDELDALEFASFGTIGATIDERRHFWNAVNAIEKSPQGDTVTIRFADHPEWWDLAIQNLDTAPGDVRLALKDQQLNGEPKDVSGKYPTPTAFAIHQWAVNLLPEAPIEIEPGRGGRIQNRIIAELPFELEGRERVEIVRNFTDKLAEKGLPYWAVIHAPDHNNDLRNYHVHIIYYDRPAGRMKDPKNPAGGELWDFEIEDEKIYKSRNRKKFRPFMQPKLREASEQPWIPQLREHWKDVSNDVMEKAGVIKRYDARSYEAMGIDLDPLKHIPSKTFNKERKGELTEDGVVLARRQWQVMQDRLVNDHEKRARHRQRILKEKTDKARQVLGSKSPYKDIALKEVDRLTKLVEQAGSLVSTNELFQDLGRIVINRVASRPKLIIAADEKKNEKSPGRTKSKRGQGHGQTTQAPEDKNGATQPVGRAAKEAMAFLLEVYGRGMQIDKRNQIELDVSRGHLNSLLKRLDNMIADPKRHPLDRRAPGFIDLTIADPSADVVSAQKKERAERITDRLNAYVEATVPKILAEVAGTSTSRPEPKQENIPQGSTPTRPTVTPAEPVMRSPTSPARASSGDPIPRTTTDRVSSPRPSDLNTASAQLANTTAMQAPSAARPQEPIARPQKTRFRPEPFYKPKENAGAPAAAQAKNTAPSPVKSPAPTPANSAAKAPAPNNSRTEAGNKPAVAENTHQPSKAPVNNVVKPENAAPGTKPVRDNSGSGVSKPATAAQPPSAPAEAQRVAASPADTKPAQTQVPSRPVQAPAVPSARPTAPQAGSAKEPTTAKVTSAPAAVPEKAPAPAPVQAPRPRPEPARPAPRAEASTGKPDATKAASEVKAPARPERTPVAPKPASAESSSVRTPGERFGEYSDAKPAKEKAEIRVGNPLSPVTPKQMEPIRVEGIRPPKKPKRRDKGRDEGPSM
ncbi:MobA/MobL family protein [Microvirga sp. HBU67558]|uniref:MobA/MobL family protein n=1 Tax=Microvirga TaxID=186650 RepID=UPI001B390FB7|nr:MULTISPECIES: MobA/MobL family protein [unclassified Microvirga]MBQ0819893.1 MobA/MobL family protein [Microvirga sp. HBU67558]